MNVALVAKYLGALIFLLGLSMLPPIIWSFYQIQFAEAPSDTFFAFVLGILVAFACGMLLILYGRKSSGDIDKREAFLLVSTSWFLGSLLAAIPFWFWAIMTEFSGDQDRTFESFVSCYFEAMSGLTTTGATVLTNIDSLPQPLLLWRSLTHWIGGLGIVVLFVAILPLFGGGGARRLFKVESTGIGGDGNSHSVRDNTRTLLFIYISLTMSQTFLMKIADPQLSWFSSINHAFSTVATGGFSTSNASAGSLSQQVQWIIVLFMAIAGVNFAVYQRMLSKNWSAVVKDTELKAYLLIIVSATLVIAFFIKTGGFMTTTGNPVMTQLDDIFRDASFHTISFITSTGFATVDYDQWPSIPKMIIIILMLIGGCGGSTAGGIKVIRIVAAIKIIKVELERSFRPHVLRPIRIGTVNLEYQQRTSTLAYIFSILMLMALGILGLFLTEPASVSGTTLITAAIATVNNIGPGFAEIGAVENFGFFSDLGKFILTVLMAAGRLELFAVAVLFMPKYWTS